MDDAVIGGARIADNLARAVAAGRVVIEPDGRHALVKPPPGPSYLLVSDIRAYDCAFLNDFVFDAAYGAAAVPAGCAACFKVKVVPRDLRGLVALRGMLERLPFQSKCGVDLANRFSSDVYAGYLYFVGLADAQAGAAVLRAAVDTVHELGPDIAVRIKRGCSNYEAACGPSDRWTFEPDMADIEAALSARFRRPALRGLDYRLRRAATMTHWIRTAHSLGDTTYLDFTEGMPLYPPTISYPVPS